MEHGTLKGREGKEGENGTVAAGVRTHLRSRRRETEKEAFASAVERIRATTRLLFRSFVAHVLNSRLPREGLHNSLSDSCGGRKNVLPTFWRAGSSFFGQLRVAYFFKNIRKHEYTFVFALKVIAPIIPL